MLQARLTFSVAVSYCVCVLRVSWVCCCCFADISLWKRSKLNGSDVAFSLCNLDVKCMHDLCVILCLFRLWWCRISQETNENGRNLGFQAPTEDILDSAKRTLSFTRSVSSRS
uniref:Uncharacterized protein n=1 Tax=Amblyomma americanum TaxID=6943 RepID=A0A0C9S3U0_AMBAM